MKILTPEGELNLTRELIKKESGICLATTVMGLYLNYNCFGNINEDSIWFRLTTNCSAEMLDRVNKIKSGYLYGTWCKFKSRFESLQRGKEKQEKEKNEILQGKYFAINQLLRVKDFRKTEKILSQGFDINYKRRSDCIEIDKETLLFEVVRQNNKEGVEFLLSNGANPLLKNALGYIPIERVRWFKKNGGEIGKLLLSKMNYPATSGEEK